VQAQAELEAQRRDLGGREAAALAAEQRAVDIAEQAARQQAQQRDLDARQGDLADKEVRSRTAGLRDSTCGCLLGSQPSCRSPRITMLTRIKLWFLPGAMAYRLECVHALSGDMTWHSAAHL